MTLSAALVRRPALLLVVPLLAALALVGCGGSSPDASEGTEPAPGAEPTLGIEAPPVPAGAESYTAPSGSFTLAVPGSWRLPNLDVERAEAVWFTDGGGAEFDPNVNVLIERLAAAVSIDEYLEISVANGPRLVEGFEPLDVRKVRLTNGELGGRLEYTGEFRGKTFRFLAIVSIDEAVAAVATYTNLAGPYFDDVGQVEPYLLTLAAAGVLPEPEPGAKTKKKKKKKGKKAKKKAAATS